MTNDLMALLERELPVAPKPCALKLATTGLVVVDQVHGFCTVGAGNLAPQHPNPQVDRMVETTAGLARRFADAHRPILAFLDTHEPGVPEPPYPPHCERGTGEENLVPQLAWLDDEPNATLIRKDCINGFVGGIENSSHHGLHHNKVIDWINVHRLNTVLVTGICTDICVMDFVLTLLSARNHRLMPSLEDITVLEPACATYDLPKDTASAQNLPATAAHPQAATHHMGLYFMASRGALLASEIDWT
ncbi:MAG: isochorismatase family protein [Pseudomonadota bacterium]